MKTPRKKLEKKADKLFADKVKSKGRCEKCKSRDYLQCAHIISRRYKQVRWDLDNAVTLCRGCHVYFTHHPIEWEDWVINRMGEENYQMLRTRALQYGKIDYDKVIDLLSSE